MRGARARVRVHVGRGGQMAQAAEAAAAEEANVPAAASSGAGRRLDPLVLLRRCAVANKNVKLHDEALDFDGHLVHRNAKCGFKLSPADSCIDIGSVWFMFREISGDKPYTQDVAKKHGFKYIGVAHRGDLCDYLVGRAEKCRGLVLEVVEGRKRPLEDRGAGVPRSARARAAGAGGKNRASAASDGGAAGSGGGRELSLPKSGKDIKAADISYADVQARVRPVKDLDVLVRCPGRVVPNADLILKIAQDEVNNWHVRRRIDGPRDAASLGGKVPLIREFEALIKEDKANKPIILVPCNKTSPVNLLNVVKFLQDGVYEKTDLEHTRYFESTRMEYVDLVRNVQGRMWTFEVRDTAKNFTKAQWLRVVAVVADGSEWQFTGWPFETVVDLFTTVKGVFFRENGTLTPLHVREWSVGILDMHPLQLQHRFAEVRDLFWVEVEKFLASYRNKKFVNHTTLDKVRISGEKPKPVL